MRIRKKGRTILKDIEVARSFAQKAKGLMGRAEMGSGGMLMIFSGRDKPGIWMLFMRFPIDIVFISNGKRIVDIKRNVPPMSFHPRTWRVYRPNKRAKYALELPAHSAKKLKPGDIVSFNE